MEVGGALEAALLRRGGFHDLGSALDAGKLLSDAKKRAEKGSPESAIQPAKNALALFREAGNSDGMEEALGVLVAAHVSARRIELAAKEAEEALSFYENSGDERGKAGALRSLVGPLRLQGKLDEALRVARQTLELCETLGHSRGKQEALRLLLDVHAARGEPDLGLEEAKRALARCEHAREKGAEAFVLAPMIHFVLTAEGIPDSAAAEVGAWVERARAGDQKTVVDMFNGIASAHSQKGNRHEALRALKEVSQIYKQAKDDKGVADTLRTRCAMQLSWQEIDDANRSATKALMVSQDMGDTRGEVDALIAVMNVLVAKKEFAKALDTAGEAIDQIRNLDDQEGEASLLVTVADLYSSSGETSSALEIAEGARILYQELKDAHGEAALLLYHTASFHSLAGNGADALAAAETALSLFRTGGHKSGEADALSELSRMLYDAESFDEALLAASKATSLQMDLGDPVKEAEARHMVAHVHFAMGQLEDALEKADVALQLFRKHGEKRGEAALLETLAQVRVAQGDMSEAQHYAEEAQAIWAGLGEQPRAAAAAQEVYNIRIAKKEFKESLAAATAAAEACRKQGDDAGEAQQLLAIANVRLAQAEGQGQPSRKGIMEALLAALESLPLFRSTGDPYGEVAALQALAKVYRAKLEPMLAIASAKEAAAVSRAVEHMSGCAESLVLEAATYFMLEGRELQVPDEKGGLRHALAGEEAMCAAAEAQEIFQLLKDNDGVEQASKLVEGARDLLLVPYGPNVATSDQLPAEVDASLFIDLEERDPLKRMGFQFPSQGDFDRFQSNRSSTVNYYTSWPDGVVEEKLFGHRSSPNNRMNDIQLLGSC